jgi:hypothetical protein
LPKGFEFDPKYPKPTVDLVGADWSQTWTYSYTNSVLTINFSNSGNSSFDYMAISGLRIIGKSGSAQGDIQWFYGNNVFTSKTQRYFYPNNPANATSGDVYSVNGQNFVVSQTVNSSYYVQMGGSSTAPQSGTLTRVSGSGDATIPYYYTYSYTYLPGAPAFPLAKISINNPNYVPNFTNSYWYSNDSVPGQSPFPVVSSSSSATKAFRKTVIAIPDNYVDADPFVKGSVRLLPMTKPYSSLANNTFGPGDFKANIYTGTGVSGDLLNLGSVTKNVGFNITMSHTDLNGCATTQSQQYIVYDHNSPISKKLGVTQNSSIDATTGQQAQAGTTQELVNPNFSVNNSATPGASNPIPSQTLLYNEKAGYSLLQLNVDLPASELYLNSIGSTSQKITGSLWRTEVQKVLNSVTPVGNFNNYAWDYQPILKYTPPGLNNVYDYFINTQPLPSGNRYWLGGTLGKIEFTGSYQSTADNTVFVPYRQEVELFLPSVPIIEMPGAVNYDPADPAYTSLPNINPNQYPNGYPGYALTAGGFAKGTPIYCEYGGKITLQAYPQADNGATKVGKFILYDYSKWGAKAPNGTGTISVSNSALVVGVGTSFKNLPPFASTDIQPNAIIFDGSGSQIGVVQSVQDATHLTLYSWSTATLTGGFKYLNPLPTAGVNDLKNGTMELDPLAQKNSYNSILVSYAFKDNLSPAWGIGNSVIRVSPNPVPAFTVSSIAATSNSASGPASFDKFCAGSIINFSADSSTIGGSTKSDPRFNIAKYDWDFGDGNSGQNHLNGAGGTNLVVTDYQPIPSISIQPGVSYGPNNATTTYYSIPVTGGAGNGAYVDITVTNGSVSAVRWSTDATKGLIGYGTGYQANDVLRVDSTKISANPAKPGSGFSFIRGPIQTYDAPNHYYSASSTYNFALNLTSNWGCQSLAVPLANNLAPTLQASNVLYNGAPSASVGSDAAQIKVGSIPVVDYSFTGNCATQAVTFTDKSTNASDATKKFDWYFNWSPLSLLPDSTGSGKTPQFIYQNSGRYTTQLTTTTTLGCQAAKQKLLGQLNPLTQNVIDFESNDGGFLPLDISLQGQSRIYLPDSVRDGAYLGRASWVHGVTTNKNKSAFNSGTNPLYGKIWSTSKGLDNSGSPDNSYYYNNSVSGENSALYAACLTVSVPRPMISFDAFVDVSNGEGVILQYSTDALNILDPKKTWHPLGADNSNNLIPGISWYNGSALPTAPGAYSENGVPYAINSTGLGWTGSSGQWIHPAHALDNPNADLSGQALQLRFVFTSSGGPDSLGVQKVFDGVGIDNIRFGSRTRTILFENFTTTDPKSVSPNTIMVESDTIRNFVNKNISSTQIVNVNYHIGFEGQDPFNLSNPADNGARALFYGVKKVPYAFLDGLHYTSAVGPSTDPDSFQNWGQAEYDQNTLSLGQADFLGNTVINCLTCGSTTIAIHGVDSSVYDLNQWSALASRPKIAYLTTDINFTPLVDMPIGPNGTALQVGILEKAATANPTTPTGSTFDYVLRKLLPDASGTLFSDSIKGPDIAPPNSVNSPKYFPISMGKYKWIPKDLTGGAISVVVFLQNSATKHVYQAELFDGINTTAGTITSIEPTAENVNIYPNPADQELTIELPSPAKGTTTLRLANQLGQFTDCGTFAEGEQRKTISTSGLADGVYILQLGAGNSAVRSKVIVLHK